YEISNHARPGAQSRHNLVYWRYGEYVGIGPGAHGRVVTPLGRMASETEKHPETWLAMTEKQGHGVTVFDALTREEQGDEFLVMGLRLIEGIDPQRLKALSGRSLRQERIDGLKAQGLLRQDPDGRLAVTPEGLPILNAVVADLAA
ncbi:MAG: coproporphyrinogen III oxidase, partial [Salinarimonas sp.]|nr:coproporphyrinogen III oxidase [Salinarimonas sp.]